MNLTSIQVNTNEIVSVVNEPIAGSSNLINSDGVFFVNENIQKKISSLERKIFEDKYQFEFVANSKYINSNGDINDINNIKYNIYKISNINEGDILQLTGIRIQGYSIYVAYVYDSNDSLIDKYEIINTGQQIVEKDVTITFSASSNLKNASYVLINTFDMSISDYTQIISGQKINYLSVERRINELTNNNGEDWNYTNKVFPTSDLVVDSNLVAQTLSDVFISPYIGQKINWIEIYITTEGTVTISKVTNALDATNTIVEKIGQYDVNKLGWNRICLPETLILENGQSIGFFASGDTARSKYCNTTGIQSFIQVTTGTWRGNYTDFSLLVNFGYNQSYELKQTIDDITTNPDDWSYINSNNVIPTSDLVVDSSLAAQTLSDAFISPYIGQKINWIELYITTEGTVTISKVTNALDATNTIVEIIGQYDVNKLGWNRIYLPKILILNNSQSIGFFKNGDTARSKYCNTTGIQSFVQVNTNNWRGNYSDYSLLVSFGYEQSYELKQIIQIIDDITTNIDLPRLELLGTSKYINLQGVITDINDEKYNIYRITGVKQGDIFSIKLTCQGYDIFFVNVYDTFGELITQFGRLSTSTTETKDIVINLNGSSFNNLSYILLNTYKMGTNVTITEIIKESEFNIQKNLGIISKNNLKISVLGDSISTFTGYSEAGGNAMYPSGTSSWGNGKIRFSEEMWWKKLIDYMGCEIDTINAYGGSRFTSGISYPTFISRANNLGSPDMIIVEGGINEILHTSGNSLGDYKFGNASDGSKLREAIEMLIVYLLTNYPTAKLIFLIPLPNNNNRFEVKTNGISFYLLCDSIKTICNAYGVKTIDLRNEITVENSSIYLGDGIHPNKQGMEVIAKMISTEIGITIGGIL